MFVKGFERLPRTFSLLPLGTRLSWGFAKAGAAGGSVLKELIERPAVGTSVRNLGWIYASVVRFLRDEIRLKSGSYSSIQGGGFVMSKILHTGTVIIVLGLAAMMTASAFARGANFDRGGWSQPTTPVNDNSGHAGPTWGELDARRL
jgi:hypothetical protein